MARLMHERGGWSKLVCHFIVRKGRPPVIALAPEYTITVSLVQLVVQDSEGNHVMRAAHDLTGLIVLPEYRLENDDA